MAVAADGTVIDGDRMLALLAVHMRERGALVADTVVTTTMTNLGFRRAMAAEGIDVRWTDVGDRYVLAEMRSGGFALGGEQSGHILNMAHGPTGDGLAAGLQLLAAIAARGEDWPRPRRSCSRSRSCWSMCAFRRKGAPRQVPMRSGKAVGVRGGAG